MEARDSSEERDECAERPDEARDDTHEAPDERERRLARERAERSDPLSLDRSLPPSSEME